MTQRKDDNEELRGAVDSLLKEAEKLPGAIETAERTLQTLTKLNDGYPATQEFLATKGLKSVAELDEAGRKELELYLLNCLGQALSQKN